MAASDDEILEKSHRPPVRRWATKDGMGGRRCSWPR